MALEYRPMLSIRARPSESSIPKDALIEDHSCRDYYTHLCVVLHVFLILMHLGLFIVFYGHHEHSISAAVGRETEQLSLTVTITSQVIATLYTTGLVLVTQQLALRRDIHVCQTLSAIHDKSSAWLGLGSAVNALYSQFKLRTAPLGVLGIFLYLGGVFVLHVTTPALFSVVPFNSTASSIQETRLARPDLTSQAMSEFNQSFPFLEVFPVLQDRTNFTLLGLTDNIIYDVVPFVPDNIGNVTVNATVFEVDCKLPADVTQVHAPNNETFIFEFSQNVTSVVQVANSIQYLAITNATLPDSENGENHRTLPIITLTTALSIVDSDGTFPQRITISPNISYPDWPTISSLNFLACDVHTRNFTVSVPADTRQYVPSSSNQFRSTWRAWIFPQGSEDPLVNIATLVSQASQSLDPGVNCLTFADSGLSECPFPTTLEEYLATSLGLDPLVANQNKTLSLSDINHALSKALASVVWFGTSSFPDSDIAVKKLGEAIINTQATRSRLHLNPLPLFVGVSTSVLISVLAIVLVYKTYSAKFYCSIFKIGVLQIAWLFGSEPEIVKIDKPKADSLRAAGMYDVRMSDKVQAHTEQKRTCTPHYYLLLCVFLHVLLILIHVVLVVVVSHHYEQHIIVAAGRDTALLSQTVVVVSQVVGTLYTAMLVLVTQQLALGQDLHVRQTLSAIHDKSSAWLGLGSAMQMFYEQFTVRTSILGVLTIVLYLGGVFVLHITTPSLFDVIPFNASISVNQQTRSAQPQFLSHSDDLDVLSSFILPTLPVLEKQSTHTLEGLTDNVIYDVVPYVAGGIGNITVGALAVEADCRIPTQVTSTVTNGFVTFQFDPDARAGGIRLSDVYTSILTSPVTLNTTQQKTTSIALVTLWPVVDSEGMPGPVVSMTPDMATDSHTTQAPCLLVCNLNIQNTTVIVPADRRQYTSDGSFNVSNPVWNNLTEVRPTSLDDPLNYLMLSADQSTLNSYLTTSLNFGTPSPSNMTLTLQDINYVLGKAYAAIIWYGMLLYSEPAGPSTIRLTNQQGNAEILVGIVQSHLNLNELPVIVGLCTSVIMLVLALVLVARRNSDNHHDAIQSAGVLQLTWLLGSEPEIVKVREPTIDALRAAGMYDVDMSERARLRAQELDPDDENI